MTILFPEVDPCDWLPHEVYPCDWLPHGVVSCEPVFITEVVTPALLQITVSAEASGRGSAPITHGQTAMRRDLFNWRSGFVQEMLHFPSE